MKLGLGLVAVGLLVAAIVVIPAPAEARTVCLFAGGFLACGAYKVTADGLCVVAGTPGVYVPACVTNKA